MSVFLTLSSSLWACESCTHPWNFEKTVEHADAVIVGQKVSEQRSDSPEWIDVRVMQVLKGNIQDQKIRLASWYGMCSFGIVVDDKPHVMLLVNSDKSQGKLYYDAVNDGCAVKVLLVENGKVQLNGEEILLENLMAKIKEMVISK